MKVKVLIGILVALIVLNLATIGSFVYTRWRAPENDLSVVSPAPDVDRRPDAWERRGGRGRFRPSRDERQQLMALLSEFRTQTEEIRQKIFEDEFRVFELMQQDGVPVAEIDSLLEEISTSRLEVQRLAVDKLIESKAHLSPQQQRRFFNAILGMRGGAPMGKGWHRQEHRGQHRHGKGDGERL